jgi:hypothetical protein
VTWRVWAILSRAFVGPIRHSLYSPCRNCPSSIDADTWWAAGMRALKIVQTEHFVDKELYHYEQISEYRRDAYFANWTPPDPDPDF